MGRPCGTASWSSLQRGWENTETELDTVRELADKEARIIMIRLDRLQLLTVKAERLEKQLHVCAKRCRDRLAHDEAAALDSSLNRTVRSKPEANASTSVDL